MIRPAAVAGTFYPDDPTALRSMIGGFLSRVSSSAARPRALVVPHAGYIYSGPVAAAAYKALGNLTPRPGRVVLLGPSHRVPLAGMGLSGADAWQTPLGQVRLDRGLIASLTRFPGVEVNDMAHSYEHSLETQLPFLQTQLGEFLLTPIVVGAADPNDVAALLQGLSNDPDILVVVSSDLSHYLHYDVARKIDQETCEIIEQLRDNHIADRRACGCVPLRGFLKYAREQGLKATTLALANSGDTSGGRSEVVGYGAWAFE